MPGSGRSPGEGNGNPIQYPCLENPKDRGVWQATVHRVAKSQIMTKVIYHMLVNMGKKIENYLFSPYSVLSW